MPTKIILVRHGETKDNVEKRFQGWNDTPLNEAGIIQAKTVAKRLASEKVHAIYSSDLKRAAVTAEEIAKYHHLPVVYRHELRETNLGVFSGWQWEVKNPHLEELWAKFEESHAKKNIDWNEHQGESYRMHYDRTESFLQFIRQKHVNETIIAITHGGSLNRFAEVIGYKDQTTYIGYGNTAITILESTKSSFVITLNNDTAHLDTAARAVLESIDQ